MYNYIIYIWIYKIILKQYLHLYLFRIQMKYQSIAKSYIVHGRNGKA
jgi:hypothetical protein